MLCCAVEVIGLGATRALSIQLNVRASGALSVIIHMRAVAPFYVRSMGLTIWSDAMTAMILP